MVIHHGRDLTEARQYFHDLNTLEVKPNAAIAISMDSTDVATAITRKLAEVNPLLFGRVDMARRQIPKGAEELVTISGLRTGIVMTLLGPAGIQAGAKPVSLPEDTDVEQVELKTLAAWGPVLEALEKQFLDREETIVAQPIGLAGIGAMLHHVMPATLRLNWPAKKLDEVVALLTSVDWSRGQHWTSSARKVGRARDPRRRRERNQDGRAFVARRGQGVWPRNDRRTRRLESSQEPASAAARSYLLASRAGRPLVLGAPFVLTVAASRTVV